jgi:hypothetical protein
MSTFNCTVQFSERLHPPNSKIPSLLRDVGSLYSVPFLQLWKAQDATCKVTGRTAEYHRSDARCMDDVDTYAKDRHSMRVQAKPNGTERTTLPNIAQTIIASFSS